MKNRKWERERVNEREGELKKNVWEKESESEGERDLKNEK
jgi:hypothetical protein